jgi:hypothetical protein
VVVVVVGGGGGYDDDDDDDVVALMVVSIKIVVFCDVILHCLVDGYQCFGEICSLCLHGRRWRQWTSLKCRYLST